MGKKTELWRVQVEWKTAEDYDNYSHRSRNKAYVKEWLPFPRTFFGLENARKKLERILDEGETCFFPGRNVRLVNKLTGEVVPVIIEDGVVKLIKEKG